MATPSAESLIAPPHVLLSTADSIPGYRIEHVHGVVVTGIDATTHYGSEPGNLVELERKARDRYGANAVIAVRISITTGNAKIHSCAYGTAVTLEADGGR